MNSRWIWYRGDYEIYHSMLLHARREEYGADYPCMWGLANVYPRVNFMKIADLAADGFVRLRVHGIGYLLVDNIRYPSGETVAVKAGRHDFRIVAMNTKGLPAAYLESDCLATDSSWLCSPGSGVYTEHAGDEPAYTRPDDDVEVFPFVYTDVKPVTLTETSLGTLVDFGRELFARLTFDAADERVTVVYGETAEEASSYGLGFRKDALLTETVEGKGRHELTGRAFRYVTFIGKAENPTAKLELLDVTPKASFSCDDPLVEKLFGICAYTFHLNSREFLLDGIKRDRWCWSGDAYQSYMVNDYLFADRALNRRTLTALYGKPPYFEHINTINDYSALLIIGTAEYLYTTGDRDFVRFIWPRAKALYDFIVARLDENGFVTARPGDWIFIDWSAIDRTGAVCAEQILFWQACRSMAALAKAVGEPDEFTARAEELKEKIEAFYWDAEKQAYIDSFSSGKRNVTRHAAIFAILFDFVDRERAELLYRTVLTNENVTKLTTPYFEFFELKALCSLGHIEAAQDMIDSYWGGMVRLGATTIWEQYDPKESGISHYGMYGSRFGKSLCHAWGSGPVYLLGRYCLGVYPTGEGTKTFAVEPDPGRYERFEGTVPVEGGSVKVSYDHGKLTVLTDRAGGVVRFGGAEYALEANVPLTVTR